MFDNAEGCAHPPIRPLLCVLVDVEEEFDWDAPLPHGSPQVETVARLSRAHGIFAHYRVRPTYLTTYPVATDPKASGTIHEWLTDGLCDVGAHLHPWVTGPFSVGPERNESFPGNLPRELEREKLLRLSEAVEVGFGVRPITYRAGRYGFGSNTADLLAGAGYQIDTSLMPRTSYGSQGGPDFSALDCDPFWFGPNRSLLELPVTRALVGLGGNAMPILDRLSNRPFLRGLHMGSVLARARLSERLTLSPEGMDLASMQRLARALIARGTRIFTLNYHSPSLTPGHTPYVRDDRDLAIFLDRLSGFLAFFRDELGGAFVTPPQLRDMLRHGTTETAAAPPRHIPTRMAGEQRCLVVAATFPPMHGGSAIVYDSLGRFSDGRVSVLSSRTDYRTGLPIEGWRESDDLAPFPVHRVPLLRTRLTPSAVGPLSRVLNMGRDVMLRASLLARIRSLIRRERIDTICIGELVANGWLARMASLLFGVRTIIYVHGEEISTRTRYDQRGVRRRRFLRHADGVVAVSRFTRDYLISGFGVPTDKVALIPNGVDTARFVPRPRRADLVQRYGLADKRVLLTVGRLYARKGADRVIESLPALRREIPNLVYLIVGEGPYRVTLSERAESLGVSHAVIFTGELPDDELVDHYALADAFVMANREMPDGDTEGFGLVFLEANACGVPVVAGSAGGSPDAVKDGINGLLIDGNDPTAIAAAVGSILRDSNLAEQLSTTGLTVAREADWSSRVSDFLRFADRLGKR